ncbi:unnamed protein product [Clonostachys rosea]|uniref:Uncharacterized protein n=1 Tax=Bionectria ochroleuca TaxID=29856 RepID=A0ABY6UQT4_BIOOC|nr:unnamed protein product [Clonostachys rosea]
MGGAQAIPIGRDEDDDIYRLPSTLFGGGESSEVSVDLGTPMQTSNILGLEVKDSSLQAPTSTDTTGQIHRLSDSSLGKIVGTLQADLSGTETIMSALLNEDGVQLKVNSGETDDLLQIVSIPNKVKYVHRTEIKLPETPGDSIRVILHSFDVPLIIERDPRLVSSQDRGLLEYRKNRLLISSQDKSIGEDSGSHESIDNNEKGELFWWAENEK